MKTYSITYDLGKPGQNYDGLIDRIKEIAHTWARPTKSHWFVNAELTSEQLRDDLKRFLDAADRLMINEVGPNWASWGLPKEVADWLHKNWMPARANV